MLSRRRLLALGAAAGTLAGLSPRQAVAQTKLTVTPGAIRPLPIALPDFLTEPGVPDAGMGRNITQIITSNLRRSGLFAPVDQSAYPERITDINRQPRFNDWKQIGADALVTGRLERQGNGNVAAQFRLWDVVSNGHMHAQQTSTSPDNYRRLAHIISDQIYQRLTGETGYFDTRIVFIDEIRRAQSAHQAARDHGSGRRQCALPHARRRSRADAALLAVDAGNHLHVVRAGDSRASTCSTSRPASARWSAISPA